jgi:hypothetical protein
VTALSVFALLVSTFALLVSTFVFVRGEWKWREYKRRDAAIRAEVDL